MSHPPLPPSPRGPSCPPAAVLEALSAGEPAPTGVQRHVDTCTQCGPQVAALRAEAEAFLRARPPERFLKQVARRAEAPAKSRFARLLPALGVALPVLLAVLLVPQLVGDQVRQKGGALRIAIARAGSGEPELLSQDATVQPGDALRFAYEAPSDGHLLILNLDGRGQASVIHPLGGNGSAPLRAKERAFLPGSVELDDAPGPEHFVAVFAPRPLAAAPLLESLRGQAGRAEPSVSCPDCEVTSVRLQKRP